MYYVLLDPKNSTRSLHGLKTEYTKEWSVSTAKKKWPYVAKTTFTLTKSSDAEKFIIPEFWVINDGWNNTSDTAAAFYSMYKTGGTRAKYKTIHTSTELTYTESEAVITPVGKPSITITDNYNNTFTITATKGADGTNNPVTALDNLKWGYDERYINSYINKFTYPLTISGTGNTRTVYAKASSVATYGPSQEATASKAINQYIAPSTPGTPTINYTKSRLTIKESWTIEWGAATKVNTNSPIVGYRIYLFKKEPSAAVFTSIHINDSTGNQISAATADEIKVGSNTYRYYYYDTESTSCKYTIYPDQMFAPGDTVKVGIKAYTKNGKGTKLFSADGQGTAFPVYSTANYQVQNAGIVKVNTGTSTKPVWVEGQVKVYAAKAGKPNEFEWKEAEVVKVYNGSTWDESK
jgi:hypothetical protein